MSNNMKQYRNKSKKQDKKLFQLFESVNKFRLENSQYLLPNIQIKQKSQKTYQIIQTHSTYEMNN